MCLYTGWHKSPSLANASKEGTLGISQHSGTNRLKNQVVKEFRQAEQILGQHGVRQCEPFNAEIIAAEV